MSFQNSHVEALTPSVVVLEDGGPKEILKVNPGHKMGALIQED